MTSEPPNEPPVSEGRSFYRRKARVGMEIDWGSTMLTGVVSDIGPRGLFVELTPPLWVGATFSARLMLDPVLQLNCTVRRVEPGKGFAVVFELPEESTQSQFEAILAALPLL
jgi:hypothetical protein